MANIKSAPFAPPWVRSACCVLQMVPFIGVCFGIAAGVVKSYGLFSLPLAALICKNAHYSLVHGRCPPSSWRIAIRTFGFRLRERADKG